MKLKDKWRFAIGTTSRVPDSGGLHYLIADFDELTIPRFPARYAAGINNMILQKTTHGWHMYTDTVLPFNLLVNTLKEIKADPAWVRIGEERGYYFLADKSMIVFPWPVEHMVISHGKDKL